MATTRFVFTPESAHFPSTGFAALSVSTYQNRPMLAFDSGATEEEAWWTFVAHQGLTGTLSAVITYYSLATSGTVAWNIYIEAPTTSEDLDSNNAPYWGTTNDSSADTVPATAGYLKQTTVTLTNTDSIAAGNYGRLRLVRDTSVDTAAADACVLSVEIREA